MSCIIRFGEIKASHFLELIVIRLFSDVLKVSVWFCFLLLEVDIKVDGYFFIGSLYLVGVKTGFDL